MLICYLGVNDSTVINSDTVSVVESQRLTDLHRLVVFVFRSYVQYSENFLQIPLLFSPGNYHTLHLIAVLQSTIESSDEVAEPELVKSMTNLL